jgi:hypothetical protein
MIDYTTMSFGLLARLAHRAEDTDDDIMLNDVMGEVARRDSMATWTSPVTGITYQTGQASTLFHNHYMTEMAERAKTKRKTK